MEKRGKNKITNWSIAGEVANLIEKRFGIELTYENVDEINNNISISRGIEEENLFCNVKKTINEYFCGYLNELEYPKNLAKCKCDFKNRTKIFYAVGDSCDEVIKIIQKKAIDVGATAKNSQGKINVVFYSPINDYSYLDLNEVNNENKINDDFINAWNDSDLCYTISIF
jgi:hypothetical protein